MLRQTSTHASLLARLGEGNDAEAWREFTDRYAELIRAYARRRGLQSADCDDVFQEVMLALSRNMPGFEYDPARGRFRGYLKTIALRAIVRKTCQKEGRTAQEMIEQSIQAAEGDPGAEEQWEAEWRQHHLRRAMSAARQEFNDTDLAAFDLYVGQGRDASAVAAELGVSVDSVYQAKARVLRRLRGLIAAQVADEG